MQYPTNRKQYLTMSPEWKPSSGHARRESFGRQIGYQVATEDDDCAFTTPDSNTRSLTVAERPRATQRYS